MTGLPPGGGNLHIVDLRRIAVVGTSFRRVGFERLARLAGGRPAPEAAAALRAALAASEAAVVSTCNRFEAYLAFAGPAPAPDALLARAEEALRAEPSALFAATGPGALAHLFAVAASLDSLVLGECQIAGQLRRALEAARAAGLAGSLLERAFDRAARAARRVRAETAIGRTPVSVASLCARRVRDHFAAAPGGRPRRAALVGAGEMIRKAAAALADLGAPLLFVNRTPEKAAALAARFGGGHLSLDAFRAAPPTGVDAILTATSAPAPILGERELVACGRPALVCDLGLPPDVDPAVARLAGVTLVTLADLEAIARENRARLSGEVEHAEAILAEEVEAAVRASRLRAVAEESVEALLAEKLAHLAAEDRATLRRFALGLAERLARQPAVC